MALSMARPQKHPKTGVYYFRRAVPADLRDVLDGKHEEKVSLRTKDLDEARRRHAVKYAEVSREWADHRRRLAALSSPPLTQLDAVTIKKIGEAYYAHLLEEDDETRLIGFTTPEHVPDTPTPTFDEYAADDADFEASARHDWARGNTDDFYLSEVDEVLSWEGFELRLAPNSPSRKLVARELQTAVIRAAKAKQERNRGEPIPTPDYPSALQKPQHPSGSAAAAHPLMQLFADWWREAERTGLKPSTHDNYRNTVNKVIAFLGHDDAAKITPEDVIRFKDHRLSSINPRTNRPISAKTVNDGDLAALKAILGWALIQRRLSHNAADGISIKLRKNKGPLRRGFTDEEAKALLTAADNTPRGRKTLQRYWAERWVPWLCAYTGARAGEIVQLRKQDVRKEGDHYVIHIDPEAGTVKTDLPRDVVLHPHLAEKGFPEFVASSPSGYLFIEPSSPSRVLRTLKTRRNDVGEFARNVVPDRAVDPSHGWRHRFTRLWMESGLPERTMDYIEGHAGANVSRRDYPADNTVKMQAMHLANFPRQGE